MITGRPQTRLTVGRNLQIDGRPAKAKFNELLARRTKQLRVKDVSAGVTKRLWEIGDIVDIIEAFETAQKRAA